MRVIFQGKTKTGKDILVRYPELDDVEVLLSFINTLSDERTFLRYQGEHETLESERAWLVGRCKDIESKKAVQLLAFSGDVLLGSCEIHMSDKTEQHVGILGISVAKDYRGDGIGKMLMDLVLREAKKELAQLRIVTLNVYSTNQIARKLYENMGFVQYGLLPDGVYRNSVYEDRILLYKKIVEE